MKKGWMRHVTWYLVVAMFVIGITPRLYAGFSASEVVGFSPVDRASDLGKIQNAIETKMIGERLRQIGLTADEIQKKLSLMTDQQIHQLAQQLDELRVGGDSGWVAFGIVIGLAAIAILIIYLSGHEIVIR